MTKDYFIYGLRPVLEAIDSGKEIERLLIQKGLKGDLFAELMKRTSQLQIPVQMVPVEKLNRYPGKNHQGVIAILSPILYQSIEAIIPGIFEQGKNPIVLVLDSLTDVRNLGAIARTAECTGVDAIIVPARGSAQINADAVKTSAGALTRIPVCRSFSLYRTCLYLKNSGLQVIAASEKGNILYHQISYSQPTAIVMGSEETGISNDLIKLADHLVYLPLIGEIKSLNVSVAAGVVLYEIIRQRHPSL